MKPQKRRWFCTLLMGVAGVMICATDLYAQQDAISNQTEASDVVLYNGIRLPAIWPPDDGDPYSSAPRTVPYLEHPPEVIPIDVGRQLFIDNFLIERTDLKRVYHQAKKYTGNPVMKQASLRHGGVFYDPLKGRFNMYYNDGGEGVGLAVSQDLKHWRNPEGGADSRRVVLRTKGANGFWLQPGDTSGSAFYAMIARKIDPKPKNDPEVPYINVNWENIAYRSKDGIHWSELGSLGRSNDYSSFFYNPFRNVWVFSIKENVPRTGKTLYRSRYYAERKTISASNPFRNPVFWVNADTLDKPHPEVGDSAQLYSLHGIAYESILLGAFQIHLGPANEISAESKEPKFTEIKLGYSRDGFHWFRPDRRAFIQGTYQDGDWDKAFINIPQGICLVMRDTLWFPYGGYSGVDQDGKKGMYRGASIGMATLRRDGFASMQAGDKPGTLLTRKVLFSGQYLFVNVDCPAGELRVAVLNAQGQPIDYLNAEDCKVIQVDETRYKVEWNTKKDLSSLAGTPVRFRFHLKRGKLYSFWVSPEENGASYGYLGAGGRESPERLDTQGDQSKTPGGS